MIIGMLAVLAILPMAIDSEAVLWDLIIEATVENNGLFQGQSPIISGVVRDHAGKPIEGVEIHLRAGQDNVFLITDSDGKFRVELTEFNKIPGNYIVNIVGTSPDGKTGLATVNFQVRGTLQPYSASEQLLSTPEAQKYLSMNQEDVQNDPIAIRLYNYYQNIQEQYVQEKKLAKILAERELIIQGQRAVADEHLQKDIEERRPGAGVYSGYKYDEFVDNLDPSVKDIIKNQLEYTKSAFNNAQIAMEEVLENGGTYKEAREAYYAKLTTSQESMNELTTEQTTSTTESEEPIPESTETESTETDNVETENAEPANVEESEELTFQELLRLPGVEITTDGDSIFVSVNDTTVEFILDGTEFIRVTQNE